MIHFGKEEVLTALWDISTKQLSYRFIAILELPENLKTNWIYHNKKGESLKLSPSFVPLNVLFSNQFLEDLDKIWELRKYIPNPKELKYTIGNKQDLVKNKE